ncbi:hypothetical protein ACRE_023890 [Hapsidospora chrysogenum ATCC 11550]|uniref:BZIP domain-containing protein n=1 Tax=Hapsidospora chrysogenum (strain ATCC 11550 / CBS 779.69 / DSM 880 / IAM 14645 / JCM 23072 / IMI 49137) TaxID=857340 RepID=A0A086TBK7_HAPC1|nr:hypothetical protein ACRE_023890 [Hapsidospora chrysogenum ATCC 11550]
MKKQEDRRVSNMTPEQVSRKRAVDRYNQRSHRARNKVYIRHLEAKVAELSYKLESAEARLLQYEGNGSRNHGGEHPGGHLASPPLTHEASLIRQDGSGASDCHGSRSPDNATDRSLAERNKGDYSDSVHGKYRKPLPLDFGSGIAANIYESPRDLTFRGMSPPEANAVDAPETKATLTIPRGASGDTGLSASPPSDSTTNVPEWQRLPMHLPPTTELDEIIIHKSRLWREKYLKSGRQITELDEARFPSISSLLNQPLDEGDTMPRPVSDEVAAQVLNLPVRSLVERIGFMYKISYFVRWLVCQTEQTYNQMPDFMKPTELQRTVPHPAWIDVLTFPDARDELIRQGNWSVYETFRSLTGASISVTWPYPDSGAFMESADGQSLRLNPMFEAHIRCLGNWKLGKEVGEVFPFMKPYVRQERGRLGNLRVNSRNV